MTAPITPGASPRPPARIARRAAIWLFPRRGIQLRLLLATPLGWLVIAYLGSLVVLLLNAFWAKDAFTGNVEPFAWTLDAFNSLFRNEVYRTVALRTIGMAALVTITDVLLAFPIAYYMSRIASPRVRNALVFPALVAGSIFTFSLTLGDYITPDLVSDAKFIGNVIYDNSSLGNLPLAAGYSLLPIVIMTVYLLVARRLGAFDSL